MRRFLLLLTFIFSVMLLNMLQVEADIGKPVKIFSTPNKEQSFSGYAIKDGVLYFCIRFYDRSPEKTYRYSNHKIEEINTNEKENKLSFENFVPYSNENLDNQGNVIFIINDNLSVRFEEWALGIFYVYVKKDGVEKEVLNDMYRCYISQMGGYVYIDKENQKIYFNGATVSKNQNNLLVYDMINNEFYPLNSSKKAAFFDPIRIPDTSLILYQGSGDDSKSVDIYIQEIPEWKAELEAKNKENDIEVSKNAEEKQEVKYIIDGPANIRNKAKGKKVIGSIEDKAEVKVLNKKGDWYEVQSGDIKGWTFKDNVKEVK